MMAKQASTVEGLVQDLQRLKGLHEEAKGRITGLEREVALLEERDRELARRGFQGEAVGKERAKLHETLDAKGRELKRETQDLGILEQELQRVEAEHQVAQRQADEACAEAGAQRRQAGLVVVAREIREALAGVVSRLEELFAEHQDERQLRNRLNGSFECPGEKDLERLRYLIQELLNGARAIEEGTS